MKRKIAAVALMLIMSMAIPVSAGDITVNVNGVKLETDQPPIILNGRTLVPLRAVAEALGCEVEWDNASKTASFVQGDVTAVITVGQNYILVGDGVFNAEFPIDSPAVIKNNRTLIPMRALSECFGYDVNWNGETMTVDINTKAMDTDDTNSADEQTAIETTDNMEGKVSAYAEILRGTVKIIDAVNYESENYLTLKSELDAIAEGVDDMNYDELITAFTKLKEIDESLGDMASDAGVSDIVESYYSELEDSLNDVIKE